MIDFKSEHSGGGGSSNMLFRMYEMQRTVNPVREVRSDWAGGVCSIWWQRYTAAAAVGGGATC